MSDSSRMLISALWLACSLVVTTPAGAQATVNDFSFAQIDFYDQDATLHTSDSSWGVVEFEVTADPVEVYYLNVTADAGSGPSWIVVNLPLTPEVVRGPRVGRQSVDFDISQLGVPAGNHLPSVAFGFSVLDAPSTAAPAVDGNPVPVDDVPRRNSGSRLQSPPLPADVGSPAGVQNACCDPALAMVQHRDVSAVQEADAKCLAGSSARGVAWLESELGPDLGGPAPQIYDELAAFDDPVPASFSEFVSLMAQRLSLDSAGRSVTKILDLDDAIPPVPGVPEQSGGDLIEWLKRELPTAAVELLYGDHSVTLSGLFVQGGKDYVRYRDDEAQGDPTSGDAAEKVAELRANGDGSYSFRAQDSDAFWIVQGAVAESILARMRANRNETSDSSVYSWHHMISGESLFDVVAGSSLNQLRDSRGDFTLSTEGCLNDIVENDFSVSIVPPPGDAYWFLHRTINSGGPGTYNSGGLNQLGDRDAEIDAAIYSCPSCAHDKCVPGRPLDAACSGCVDEICLVDAYCCQTEWDGHCVELVREVCRTQRCAESRGSCPHTLCTEGVALTPGCDSPPEPMSCVEDICADFPECCTESWDALCVFFAGHLCGLTCD